MTGWAERDTKLRGKAGEKGGTCPMTGWAERDTKLRGKGGREGQAGLRGKEGDVP